MPTCVKCSAVFPGWVTVAGKKRCLSARKYCLECSPFGVNNRKPLHIPPGNKTPCVECGRLWTSKPQRRTVLAGGRCSSCTTKARRIALGAKAVAYAGGCCVICGYQRCAMAFDFHHLRDKSFNVSQAIARTRSWDVIRAEIDKCVLLCACCHRELHAGVAQLPEHLVRTQAAVG